MDTDLECTQRILSLSLLKFCLTLFLLFVVLPLSMLSYLVLLVYLDIRGSNSAHFGRWVGIGILMSPMVMLSILYVVIHMIDKLSNEDEEEGVKNMEDVIEPAISQVREADGDAEEATCVICLEKMEVGKLYRVFPKCKHEFHEKCLFDWLDKGKRSCPICRSVMPHRKTEEDSAHH